MLNSEECNIRNDAIGDFGTMLLNIMSNNTKFIQSVDGEMHECIDIDVIDDLIYECIAKARKD